jgi:osmotically inducible protein OsmC
MAAVRQADATWSGNLPDGKGTVSAVSSGAFSVLPTTWASRVESSDGRTSPEELLAAAHASCFSMALANMLAQAGTPANSIKTDASVTLRFVDGVPTITNIELTTVGQVPGISEDDFRGHAEAAKAGCPVSRALAAVPEVTLAASLAG